MAATDNTTADLTVVWGLEGLEDSGDASSGGQGQGDQGGGGDGAAGYTRGIGEIRD